MLTTSKPAPPASSQTAQTPSVPDYKDVRVQILREYCRYYGMIPTIPMSYWPKR